MISAGRMERRGSPGTPATRRGGCKTLLGLFVLVMVLWLGFLRASPAWACSIESQTSPPEGAPRVFEEETSAPLVVGEVKVKRRSKPHCHLSPCGGGLGIVTIPLSLPATSRQSICRLELAVSLIGGTPPPPLDTLRPRAGVDCRPNEEPALILAFADAAPEVPVAFDVSVALVDETDVTGPPVVVPIRHAGGHSVTSCPNKETNMSGCSYSPTKAPPGSWALLLLLLLVVLAAATGRRRSA
jgi:MYXO-CTERM domain-containing protein